MQSLGYLSAMIYSSSQSVKIRTEIFMFQTPLCQTGRYPTTDLFVHKTYQWWWICKNWFAVYITWVGVGLWCCTCFGSSGLKQNYNTVFRSGNPMFVSFQNQVIISICIINIWQYRPYCWFICNQDFPDVNSKLCISLFYQVVDILVNGAYKTLV